MISSVIAFVTSTQSPAAYTFGTVVSMCGVTFIANCPSSQPMLSASSVCGLTPVDNITISAGFSSPSIVTDSTFVSPFIDCTAEPVRISMFLLWRCSWNLSDISWSNDLGNSCGIISAIVTFIPLFASSEPSSNPIAPPPTNVTF